MVIEENTQKIICKTIKYWIIIVNLPEDNIVKQMYTVLEGLHHIGHKTWNSQVKDIIEKAELAELWTDVSSKKTVLKYIRYHLESIFRQHWLDEIIILSRILSLDFIKKLNTHSWQNPTFSLPF